MLKQSLQTLKIDCKDIPLSHPSDPAHGDYATGIALQLAKQLKKNPMDLAQQIADAIPKDESIERTEVANPGFINIWLSPLYLINIMKQIAEKDFDVKEEFANKDRKNILLEFGQPNTHKAPHIGHLFSYIYGESLARVFESQGNKVIRTNYQGDIGLHVAKCLYVARKKPLPEWVKTLRDKVIYLQECYQEGTEAYEKNTKVKREIDELNDALFRQSDEELNALWKETRQWCLDFYKNGEKDKSFAGFEKLLGIRYDKYYFESETGPIGKSRVEKNISKIFEKSEGAIIFNGEKYGLHKRVFITKQGNPTYEAKDIGLMSLKKNDFPFDLSLVTTANEQNAYWKVVIKACELLFPDLQNKLKHLGFGMINLTTGKMSSRAGKIVNGLFLYEDVRDEIKNKFQIKEEKLAEIIALASIKYSFLKSDPFKNITFDIEKSITKEGNSGPYLLYTFVRTQSILNQSNERLNDVTNGGKLEKEEQSLLRLFYQFPEVVEQAAKLYSPSVIATYLFNLAQTYNLFYQKHQVLKAAESKRKLRLALTTATGSIIKQGLNLLGIQTVSKM